MAAMNSVSPSFPLQARLRCARVRQIAWLLSWMMLGGLGNAQRLTSVDRNLAQTMLQDVSNDVKRNYYDPKFHGLDWDALVNETKKKIDNAPDMGSANAEIEALLGRLQDSHTNFHPPRRIETVDYGWKFMIIGSKAFVTEVKPDSDAQSKGVKPGDEVLTINGFSVDRAGISMLEYAMNIFTPATSLDVVLRNPAGKIVHTSLAAKIHKHPPMFGLGDSTWNLNAVRIREESEWENARSRYKEFGPGLMILRIPEFVEVDSEVEALIKKAKNHKTLIVDLRGCPGGLVDSVQSFLSDIFDRDIKIGNWVERSKPRELTIKSGDRYAFSGDLIVLIDSETASAGEIFSRVVQLQERGTLIGDHTSGMTMESRFYRHETGANPVFIFGDSVTVADAVMSDGKSIEHVGVEPDRKLLPTAADLAAHRDPVLAYAASLAGVTITPEDAAKLFPRPANEDDDKF